MFVAHIDPWPSPPPPQGDLSGYALGTVNGSTETWTDLRPVNGGHMFDVATFDGTDLWMVGAVDNATGGTDGVAWRSRDGGTTWQEALRVPPQRGGIARLYAIHAYNGRLYTQGQDFNPWGPHARSKVFDGVNWSDGPDLGLGFTGNIGHTETFAGQMVYHRGHAGVDPGGTRLFKFDGTRASFAYTDERFYDFTVADDMLYALLTDGRVLRTTDLQDWRLLDTAPTSARSLGVLDNTLYLGATGGQLYRYGVPVPVSREDVNFDGRVNAIDLLAVRQHLGEREAPWDVNGDRRVNVVDLRLVREEMRRAAGSRADGLVVPEPSSVLLLGLCASTLLLRRRRS